MGCGCKKNKTVMKPVAVKPKVTLTNGRTPTVGKVKKS
tara:strand:+ start:988 stop:1101 length:114 start_codon:yes stop_codon:yes gene_type:complete